MAVTPPGIGLTDRVYARAFAITTRGEPRDAVAELVILADHNAHILGRVRDRLEALVHERPASVHARQALCLATKAWMLAIEGGP